ncbi:MAG: hypothetical protein IJF84_13220 [Thermoguttaceae bacterium]|nr:hypothetical protein [Thermoguttaceae bacterium]
MEPLYYHVSDSSLDGTMYSKPIPTQYTTSQFGLHIFFAHRLTIPKSECFCLHVLLDP